MDELVLENLWREIFFATRDLMSKHNTLDVSNHCFMTLLMIHMTEKESERVTVSKYADFFQVSLPAAIKTLKTLEKQSHLKKVVCDDDKRVKYYILTEKTRNQLDESVELKRQNMRKVFEKFFDAQDIEAFKKLTDKLKKFRSEIND